MSVPTIQELYQQIADEKDTKASLSGLLPASDNLPLLLDDLANNPSDVAVWRRWAFIYGDAQRTIYEKFEDLKVDIATMVANQIPQTTRWYQEQAFKFQYGDPLTWLTNADGSGKYGYAVVDATKQIVNRCAAIETGDQILIKAAIFSGGVLRKLTAPELTAFLAYYKKIKMPGPQLICISLDADLVQLEADIYFDGLADLPTLQANVGAAVDTYFAGISGLGGNDSFNGILNLNQLTDAMQAVRSVVDPRLTRVQIKSGANPYTDVAGERGLVAGYCKIDPAYPLTATINYIPHV